MNSVDIAGQASKVEKADLMCDSGAEKKSLLNVILRSYVVWALLALVAANLLFQELPFDRYASANRSMVWWAVDDFRRQKKCPDVVLIGSSLLMHVQYFGNADYLKLPQNEVYHHKSVMLEDLLRRRTGVKVDSFAFAIGGTMASDAYALASTLFSQKRKPKVVIYGIAPRDFIDNILCSPASTETFRLMSRLDGVKDVEWAERDGFWEKVEYLFESASSLYKHRNYFVHLQQHYVKLLLRLDGYKITDEVHIPFALRVLSCRDMPEDIGSNEKIILPNRPIRWLDNRSEYRRRYQPFNASAFMN